ncbi:hypothetical protein [Photobacterium sp.]|uniref:hypothetical protein n=1 Tax=Photobacterium sp. TaxID=660 RepID=UPI00299DE61B|nr:hypothetical protein [Photobacterium sp.]MDX1302438.1 hypothetical protein [Photobacterium sp.]
MLTLISSQPDIPSEVVSQHISDHAPALALSALGVISGEVSCPSLKRTCTEHFHEWWKLSVAAGTPNGKYESVYWYLLQLLETQEDYQLLGNSFVQFKVTSCAQFLLGIGPAPEKMQGIRP